MITDMFLAETNRFIDDTCNALALARKAAIVCGYPSQKIDERITMAMKDRMEAYADMTSEELADLIDDYMRKRRGARK